MAAIADASLSSDLTRIQLGRVSRVSPRSVRVAGGSHVNLPLQKPDFLFQVFKILLLQDSHNAFSKTRRRIVLGRCGDAVQKCGQTVGN